MHANEKQSFSECTTGKQAAIEFIMYFDTVYPKNKTVRLSFFCDLYTRHHTLWSLYFVYCGVIYFGPKSTCQPKQMCIMFTFTVNTFLTCNNSVTYSVPLYCCLISIHILFRSNCPIWLCENISDRLERKEAILWHTNIIIELISSHQYTEFVIIFIRINHWIDLFIHCTVFVLIWIPTSVPRSRIASTASKQVPQPVNSQWNRKKGSGNWFALI